jgi:E3 ubiquitin-protein ligase UBR3
MTGSALGKRSAMMVVPQGTSPEIMSAVQAMLDEATNQVEAVENFVQSHTRRVSDSPSVRSQGVSVNFDSIKTNKAIPVNESMMTLLIKLHARLSGKVNSYVPESQRVGCSATTDHDCCVGDGPYYISRLLDKACRLSPECAQVVENIYSVTLPRDRGGNSKRKDMTDKDER